MELVGFLLGSVLGSFILVLSERGLTDKTFWGRSCCPNCKKKLAWYDLFPILSYLLLQGCCRYCKKRIKVEYLLVEIATGLIIAFLFWQNIKNFQSLCFSNCVWLNYLDFSIFVLDLIFKIFFIVILVALFITDLKKMLIPDRIIIPSLKIGLVSLFLITIYKIGFLYYSLSQSLLGRYLLPPRSDYFVRHALMIANPLTAGFITAFLIGGFFWGLIVITKGKGMGGGDVKLGAFMGLILGFPQALVAIVLSFVTGAIFSIVLLILGKKHFGQTIPFGPFLVLGSLVTLFWGNQIFNWYLHLSIK